MWLFVLFVAVPLIEIALFIRVGGLIGLWPTLLIVVLTALLGTHLVRSQGALALSELKRSLNDLRDPSEPLAHGAMILFAGALLLTPGFFTDAAGFALLVPGVRRAILRQMRARMVTLTELRPGPGAAPRPGARPDGPGDIIDGEFEELTPGCRPTHRPAGRPSGWTRH